MCLLCSLMGVEFDVSLGSTHNFTSKVTIENLSNGNQNISFSSQPSTYGLKSPQYYSLRLRHQTKEFELIHHKLYFETNLPEEVSHFEITDGYNMLMLNILTPVSFKGISDIFTFRFGFGMVVAHPDITINDSRFYKKGGGLVPTVWVDGYQISGPCSQIGFNIRKIINNKFSFNAEAKLSYAKSVIDLEEEYRLSIPNLAVHILMGISFGK